MCSLTQSKVTYMINELKNSGYSLESIKEAFEYIYACSETERISGVKKTAPNLLKTATRNLSIYTYILRLSVKEMISDWEKANYGRLSAKNISMYDLICKMCLERADKLISENISTHNLCN